MVWSYAATQMAVNIITALPPTPRQGIGQQTLDHHAAGAHLDRDVCLHLLHHAALHAGFGGSSRRAMPH